MTKLSRWQSLATMRRERIAVLLHAHKDLTSDETLRDFADNALKNDRLTLLTWVVQYGLLIFLLANLYKVPIDVKIFDTDISSALPIREILLLASSIIGMATFVIRYQNEYLNDFIDESLKIRYPTGHAIIRHRFRRLPGDPFKYSWAFEYRPIRGVRFIAALVAMLTLLVGAACITLIMLIVHLSVIWKMWNEPNLPMMINRLIIFAVIAFDVFDISLVVIDKMPFPVRANRTAPQPKK